MGNALDALFSSEEPKKGTKTTKVATEAQSDPPAKAANKKTCPECGAEVWPFNLRDGGCIQCVGKKKKTKKSKPTPPKAQPAAKKSTKAQPKATTPKTDGRQRGLDSNQWHEKEATFKQTKFLKENTGLQTWNNENFTLKRPMTRQEASVMISEIKQGNGGVKDVTAILKREFGCIKYVRPGKKTANSRPDPAASSNVDRDTAAELVELKRMNRELMAKIEAMTA